MSFPGGTPPPAGVLIINNCPACQQCQACPAPQPCPAIDVGSHLARTVSIWISCIVAVVLVTYLIASYIRRRRPATAVVAPPPPPRSPPGTPLRVRERDATAPPVYVPRPYPYPYFVNVVNDADELEMAAAAGNMAAATTGCAIM